VKRLAPREIKNENPLEQENIGPWPDAMS
jgi:hypothetical protein